MGEWDIPEVGSGRENVVVMPAEVGQDTRARVRDREIVEGPEEVGGGRFCELLQPFHDNYLAIPDFDANGEDIEAICNNGQIFRVSGFDPRFESPGDYVRGLLHPCTNSRLETEVSIESERTYRAKA